MIGADGLHQTWIDVVFLVVLGFVSLSSVIVAVILRRIVRLLALLEDEVARRLKA